MSITFSRYLYRNIITAVLFIALGCVLVYAVLLHWSKQELELDDVLIIDFASGSSSRQVARQLHAEGLIDEPLMFRLWTRLHNIDRVLKAGEYELRPGDSLEDLLRRMQRGETRHYAFTLVEGWNFRQLRAALDAHPQIVHTLADLSGEQVMQRLESAYDHPEGMFLPDTYHIEKGTPDIDLLKRAHDAMMRTLGSLWRQRQPELPLGSPYEALILASIVEKESAVAEERPQIAGVFINRLRRKMRLQTDPTVIYGMGDDYDGDIRFRDLRRDTPYNTYTRSGLPPTPIAMPGFEAIAASVQPAETEYLYFVATRDRSGRHIFSKTLAEHEKQVDIHQRGK